MKTLVILVALAVLVSVAMGLLRRSRSRAGESNKAPRSAVRPKQSEHDGVDSSHDGGE